MNRNARTRRWTALVAVLTATGVVVGASDQTMPARALPSITGVTLESTPDRPEDAVGGTRPSVSEDGRLVAFVGSPPSPADERSTTAYLRDRERDTLVQLTPRGPGMRTGETAAAVVSADGCSVTVLTQLPLNLFLDADEDARWDVYRAALPDCGVAGVRAGLDWEIVSSDYSDSALNAVVPDGGLSVSATGTIIAYVVPVGRNTDLVQVMVADLTEELGEGERLRVALGMPGEKPSSGSSYIGQYQPAVSGDGLHVAYTSDALAHQTNPNWAPVRRPGDTPATQVYLWDRGTDVVELVSTLPNSDEPGNGSASQASVSGDGMSVAFASTSRDLVAARYPACPAGGCTTTQIFVSDRDGDDDGVDDDPVLALASRRPSQDDNDVFVAGNGSSSMPSLSADGSLVAFVTRANNLLASSAKPGAGPADGEIMVSDVAAGRVRRASVQPDTATPAVGSNTAPALSATGRVVSFETGVASQIVPGAPADGSRQVVSATFPVELSMPALDVGTVPPRWPSPEWFVTVTNTGASSFVPVEITASRPEFDITGGTCFGASVPPGGTCTVRVVFTPTKKGDVNATLTLSEAGFGAAHATGVLAGSGGEPFLSASPAGIAFDRTVVGSFTEPRRITVTNTGFDQAVIESVRVTGPHPDDFLVADTTCPDAVLAPTGSCTIDVSFAARADGTRSGLVTVTTSAGSRTSVVVAGVGYYKPTISTDAVTVAGRPLIITGSGYAPETSLVINWADKSGRDATVVTDRNGAFSVRFLLADHERPGERDIVVSDPSNLMPTVRATVMVRPSRR